MFVYCNEDKQLSTLCTGAQASVSAAPQKLQATPSMQCSNQGNNFFYPFLGTSILSAILLATMVTICSCMICVYCDQRDSNKKEVSEIPLDRPPESQPPREEPPENVYDSGSVPTSTSVIPETVITEHGLGESTPTVESTYSTVIPKVSQLWYSRAFPSFSYHFQNVYGL